MGVRVGADPLIYCLEQLTDYDQFERLCNDLMVAQGYKGLEPLGGQADKGRDAIRRATGPNERSVVFGYSVREDWERKLREDCAKVKKHGHRCDVFAFVVTSRISPTERDKATSEIAREYGWELELFALERLRALLVASPQLVAQHPQIFVPPFFPRAGGLSIAGGHDIVLIDAVPADFALAGWLARRLALQGYRVWSPTTAPLAGESEHETIGCLISSRAARVVSVLSGAALADPDATARRSQAAQAGLLLPVTSEGVDWAALDSKTKGLSPAKFESGWVAGLRAVLQALEDGGVEKGAATTTLDYRVFAAADVVRPEPERLYSNQFLVTVVPPKVLCFRASDRALSQDLSTAELKWAFRRAGRVFIAFGEPPEDLRSSLGLRPDGEAILTVSAEIEGIRGWDLRTELLKKALRVHALASGLVWCPTKEEVYFPHTERFERFTFTMPDESNTWLKFWGERSYWRMDGSKTYRYALVPEFSFTESIAGDLRMELHVRIRITDEKSQLLSDRAAFSRRKRLSATWFNDEWFKRTMAIAQFLSSGAKTIALGPTGGGLSVSAKPISYEAPVSLDEDHLKDFAALRKEAIEARSDDDDEGDDDE